MREVLRSVWQEARPPGVPPRQWWDWALVAGFALAAPVEAALRPGLPARWVAAAVSAALVPTLLWRRSRPLLMVSVVVVVAGSAALMTGNDWELGSQAYLLILLFALFRWGSGRAMMAGAALLAVQVGVAAGVGQRTASDAVGGAAVLCAVAALGAALRYRAGVRRRELDQVKLRERERMARDLHDTVGHHVSAIAIRAQAGIATAASNPDAATDALRLIESEASRALTEMRGIVRVLRRDEPAERSPLPGIGDLENLAAAGTNPVVDVAVTGDVAGLPPSVAAAIYRLAQESVTNARRHARHATRVTVRVAATDDVVKLEVSDDGANPVDSGGRRAGYGLAGMAERVGLLGGTWEAGPGPDRGWTVTAVLPRTGTPA